MDIGGTSTSAMQQDALGECRGVQAGVDRRKVIVGRHYSYLPDTTIYHYDSPYLSRCEG